MKQDLDNIRNLLITLNFPIVKLEIHSNALRKAGAPLFADKIDVLVKQLDKFQAESLKSLGEDVE